MAQSPRSQADDLRAHIEALTVLERRMRLSLSTPAEVARNRVNKGYGSIAWHLRLQRFFKVNTALTADQMAAVAQGVDPRQVVTFSAVTDRLVAFTGVDAGQTDLVSGQPINFTGDGWNTADPIIPAAVITDMPRARVYGYGQVMHRTGAATSDVALDGTVTGANADIYAQLVDWSSGAVVTAWQKVATSSAGNWSGKLTGVPSNVRQWLDVQLRKGTTGTVYSLRRQFGVGILIDLQGQSIAEYLSSSGLRSDGNSPVDPFMSFFSRGKSTAGSEQGKKVKGWHRTGYNGWGETLLAQKIGELITCPVGVITGAVAGSAAGSWSGRLGAEETSIPAFDTDKMMRPGYAWWQQGHGSTADSEAVHRSDLGLIEAKRRQALDNNYKLLFTPLINSSFTDLSRTRAFQVRYLEEAMAADSRIVTTAAMVDLELKDGVHQTDNVRGAGRIVERIAAKVAYLEGVLDYDPVGPTVVSAKQLTTTKTSVTLVHSGGTGLTVPNPAARITGFEVASSSDMSGQLAISDVKIINATTIEITHADAGAGELHVQYQRGRPGNDDSVVDGIMTTVSNALYDNRLTTVNDMTGLPLRFMINPIKAAALAGTDAGTGGGGTAPPPTTARALVIGDQGGPGSIYSDRNMAYAIGNNLLWACTKVKLSSYVSAANMMQLMGSFSPDNGFDRSWQFVLNGDGHLGLAFADGGFNYQSAFSSVDVRTLNPGASGIWLGVVANPTGTNNRTVSGLKVATGDYLIPNNSVGFFTSADGVTWTLIDSVFVNVNGGIKWLGDDGNFSIGTNDANTARNAPVAGSFYYARVVDGDGKVVALFDFTKRAAFSSGTIADDNGLGTYNIYGQAAIK